MSYLSANSLFTSGRQAFYSACTSLRDKTIDSCQQVAKRARREADQRGMPWVYRIAPPRFFNIIFRSLIGLSLEESKNTELHLAACWGTTRDIDAILAKRADVNSKNWLGMTPLHYAALKGNDTGCRSLLNKGANVGAKEIRGRTPLHAAATSGNRATVLTLLKAGASHAVKAADGTTPLHHSVLNKNKEAVLTLLKAGASHAVKAADGNTPLHHAVLIENKEAVQTLVAAGADINALNSNKLSPLEACPNIEILRILLDVESHPAFASFKTLHDYCDKMFPASRDELPKDWETWLKKIKRGEDSFKELGKVFAKCEIMSSEKYLKTLETLEAVSAAPPTLESIVQYLIHEYPVFDKAWALANRDEKLNLIGITTDLEIHNQKFAPAFYEANSHVIKIKKSLDIFWKTYCVIFELMNALQRESYLRIHQLAKLGELSREEYTLLIEHLEYETMRWTHRITGIPFTSNFAEVWKLHNIPPPQESVFKELSPHADTYRKIWDRSHAAQYFKKHQELDIALRK